MSDALAQFSSIPSRLLLDTCIVNCLFDEGGYIWEGELDQGICETDLGADPQALRAIFEINERASFQFVVSPLTVAEIANVQDFADRERLLAKVGVEVPLD